VDQLKRIDHAARRAENLVRLAQEFADQASNGIGEEYENAITAMRLLDKVADELRAIREMAGQADGAADAGTKPTAPPKPMPTPRLRVPK
jgi:hypothetical protein